MKLIIVAALACVAAADPLYYTNGVYGTHFTGYTGYPYSSVYSSYPYAHRYFKREAEADPQMIYTTTGVQTPVVHTPYVHHTPVVNTHVVKPVVNTVPVVNTHVVKPVVNAVPAVHYSVPVVQKVEKAEHKVVEPAVVYKAEQPMAVKSVVKPVVTYASPLVQALTPQVVATQEIPAQVYTSYNNENQYTAVHTGLVAGVPKYHAKSAEGVEHIVHKREAEADPQMVYGVPAAVSPVVYKSPVVVKDPVVYKSPVVVKDPVVYKTPVVHYKTPVVGHTPIVQTPVVQYQVPQHHTFKAADHGVSVNTFGQAYHSSHDGLCYNNEGALVQC